MSLDGLGKDQTAFLTLYTCICCNENSYILQGQTYESKETLLSLQLIGQYGGCPAI